ncbi:MAG TPA: type IV secretory system conjugative DNA transfer family protein [Bacilli bacterium]|nr:type IV secretory system conjugative DNA transfer family protein [Bacilli bacterium]
MKLKFKARPQDWLIFVLFAIILLYIVAIAVLNIATLAGNPPVGSELKSGNFWGFNPFPAFTFKYLAATIIFYIGVVIVIFTGVKSYFFETEKGFGISSGEKDDKGYSRWCTDKEMKEKLSKINIKDEVYKASGIPLINDGKSIWVDNGDSHNIVIGSTGAGKTQDIVHPMVKVLAKNGESMIITDPKAEIYKEHAGLLKALGYNIIVLNFRDPQRGNCWNPLALPYKLYKEGNTDKAMELLDDVASNILYEEGGNKDAFWEKTSADYFAGLALGLFEDAKEEEVNINSISVMTTIGEEKFGARSSYIKEYFNSKDPASAAYTCASGTVMAAEETKASILSTFKQKIRLFASRENLSEMLATSDFDMTKIGKEKTAVFMIIQDEKKTYHALATIFVKQCYETLIGTAQETSTGSLPIRTNFILDEFQNMPPLKDITTMVAAARSRHIRLTMIIQNFAGLEATYGKEVAQTIRSNCNNLVYLLTTELAALEEISKLCGEKKSKKDDKTASTPLITVSELQLMKENEAIVIKTRTRPFKTKLKPNWKIDWGTAKYPADEFVTRIKQPIHTFDLKSFVQEQQKNKFMGMLDNNTSNPFGGMVGNPFMEQTSSIPKESFNVDELVKKIDEKIAELEEEEKLEKEKEKQKLPKEKQIIEIEPISNKEKEFDKEKQTTDNKDIKLNEEPFVNYTKGISDDQFFDDFFDE